MSIADMGGDPGRGFEERPGLSRRQLLRAGAWAAPVIVLATAAPAAAVSLDSGGTPGTTPNGFTANPGAGRLSPDMVSGASRVVATHTWGDASRPYANLSVYGPFTPGGLIQMMYVVPSGSSQLATSSPASWKWNFTTDNVKNMSATWHPGSTPSTGYWLITGAAADWAGATDSSSLYVGFSVTLS